MNILSRIAVCARAVRLAVAILVLVAPPSLRAEAPQVPSAPTPATNPPTPSSSLLGQKYLLGDFNGARSKLENEGFSFTPIYSAEVFGNPSGGRKQGAIVEGLLDLELNLDFKKMADWNASFHVSAYYPMGNSLTAGDTDELLPVSNISSYNTPHLFELWYDQKFLDDKVSFRFGQLAADSEFFVSTNAQNFLNSTYGWPGILASNAPTPNYAYAAPGLRLRLDPDEHWIFLAAVFSGNPAPDRIGDPNPNRAPDGDYDNSGADFSISGSDGVFNIDELAYNLNKEKDAHGLPGTYKIGGWLHSGTFSDQRVDDQGIPLASPASNGHPRAVDGNNGFYFVADQAVWQDKSDPNQTREIDLFTRGGNAVADRSTFDYYVDGGIVFNGFTPGRPSDLVGIATAYGHIGSGLQGYAEDQNADDGADQAVPDAEQNIELTYFAQLAPWWTLQPDLQIILHPGGSAAIPDALVLGVRTVVTF